MLMELWKIEHTSFPALLCWLTDKHLGCLPDFVCVICCLDTVFDMLNSAAPLPPVRRHTENVKGSRGCLEYDHLPGSHGRALSPSQQISTWRHSHRSWEGCNLHKNMWKYSCVKHMSASVVSRYQHKTKKDQNLCPQVMKVWISCEPLNFMKPKKFHGPGDSNQHEQHEQETWSSFTDDCRTCKVLKLWIPTQLKYGF